MTLPHVRRCSIILSLAAVSAASAQPSTVHTFVGGEAEVVSPLIDPRQVGLIERRLLVLESSAPFLSVYSTDGRLVQRTVNQGSGPREMRFGAAFAYSAAARELWVFDIPSSRALVFAVGDTLSFLRSVRTPTNIASACFLDGDLWVSAFAAGMSIHRLQERAGEAAAVASAGRPRVSHPAAEHPVFKSFAAQGFIVCNEKARTVTMVSRRVGVAVTVAVPAMTESSISVPSFRSVLFEVEDATGLRQRLPPDGRYDQIVDARLAPDGGILVILGEADKEHPGGGDYARYREVRLDTVGSPGTVRRWMHLGSVGARQFCYRSSPVPEIGSTLGARCD